MGGTCRWQPANKSGQRNFCLFYFRFNFWIAFWSHCFSTPDLFFLQFFFGLSLLCPLTHCFGFSRLFMIYKKTRRTFLCLIEICESILTTHDKFFFPFYPSHLIFPFPPIFFSLIWIIHKEDENVIWDLLRASWIVVLLGDSIFFFPLALLHALYLSFIPSHSSRCPLPSSFFFVAVDLHGGDASNVGLSSYCLSCTLSVFLLHYALIQFLHFFRWKKWDHVNPCCMKTGC